MPKTPDAFAHLPHLRGKVTAPCQSELRTTAEVLAAWDELAMLWRREMIQGSYLPTLRPVTTPQGPLCALAFVSNPESSHYVGPQPLDKTAKAIARAAGFIGSNRQYLEQLAAQLAHLDIEDDYVRQLLARVDQIAAAEMAPP